MEFLNISKENCFCVCEPINMEKLEKFFRIGQVAFVKNHSEKITGIISLNDYTGNIQDGKDLINTSFKSIRYKSGEAYMEEVRNFFRETNYQSIPVLDDNEELVECFVKAYKPWQTEDADDKWIDTANHHMAELVRRKGCKKIKISMMNEVSELIYAYFKHYEHYYDIVEKVFWYDVLETDNADIVITNDKIHAQSKVPTYSYASLRLELEYNRLLYNCQKNNVRFYMINNPSARNVWNLTQAEQERIFEHFNGRGWQHYMENAELHADLLEEVLDIRGQEDRFIDSCLNLPDAVKKGELFYQQEHISEFVNVINGNRFTEGVPERVQKHIYLAGNSFVFGPLVDDKHTLASHLQRMVNLSPEFAGCEVVNEGIRGIPIYESLKRLNDDCLKEGDITALFLELPSLLLVLEEDAAKEILSGITVYHLEDIFNALDCKKRKSYFIESPTHPNSFAYRLSAEYLMNLFKQKNSGLLSNRIPLDFESVYEKCSLIEVNNTEWKDYVGLLKKYRKNGKGAKGAIVMTCNPLTYGHKYLIEYAVQKVEHLYIFVVQEDKFFFSFKERLEMIQACAAEYSNITVLPSGQFLASLVTFPEYFVKETINPQAVINPSNDVVIFGKYIAPILNITMRFAGEEPNDFVTAAYNASMKNILPKYGIDFCEIPRYEKKGIGIISASKVREALQENAWEKIRELVPNTTYEVLEKYYKV